MGILTLGEPVLFGAAGTFRAHAGQGWCGDDNAHMTWTDGPLATLHFTLSTVRQPVTLLLQALPFLAGERLPAQELTVYLNGYFMTYVRATEPFTVAAAVERDQLSTRVNTVSFVMPRAASPASVSDSTDLRVLGLAFVRFEMTRAP